MDMASPFNKDHVRLRSKHPVALWELKTGNVMRHTPQRYQMHLVLGVPPGILLTNSVLFRCSPIERTAKWGMLFAAKRAYSSQASAVVAQISVC